MRQLLRPQRRLQEIAAVPDGIHRGKLAEDYDGIGQYIMVSLAGASVGSAFKSRIAAGDFGGGRTFPAGTVVRVHSFRGQLETFLGNKPGCEENFNRTESAQLITGLPSFGPAGLWTVDASFSSDFGPNWFAARYSNISRQNSVYIDGSQLVMDVKFRTNPEAERLLWTQSEVPLTFPIEIITSFIHEQAPWPYGFDSDDPDMTIALSSLGDAPIHNFAMYANIIFDSFDPGNVNLIVLRGGTGSGAEFDSNSSVFIPLQLNKQTLWRVRYTDPDSSEDGGLWGIKAKVWHEDDSEPDDWQAWDLVKGGTAAPVTPEELIFYSDDVGISLASKPSYAFTKWDYIHILEGGCIIGGPSDLPAVMPLP